MLRRVQASYQHVPAPSRKPGTEKARRLHPAKNTGSKSRCHPSCSLQPGLQGSSSDALLPFVTLSQLCLLPKVFCIRIDELPHLLVMSFQVSSVLNQQNLLTAAFDYTDWEVQLVREVQDRSATNGLNWNNYPFLSTGAGELMGIILQEKKLAQHGI